MQGWLQLRPSRTLCCLHGSHKARSSVCCSICLVLLARHLLVLSPFAAQVHGAPRAHARADLMTCLGCLRGPADGIPRRPWVPASEPTASWAGSARKTAEAPCRTVIMTSSAAPAQSMIPAHQKMAQNEARPWSDPATVRARAAAFQRTRQHKRTRAHAHVMAQHIQPVQQTSNAL